MFGVPKIDVFHTPFDSGILTIGDKGVGRSQLSNVLSGNLFEPKTLYSLPQLIELFSFQSQFETFKKSLIMIAPPQDPENAFQSKALRNVQIIMFLASYDSLESFEDVINKWIPAASNNESLFQPRAKYVVVLTKSDLIGTEHQKVTNDMISNLDSDKFTIYSVSAKTNEGIDNLKEQIINIVDDNTQFKYIYPKNVDQKKKKRKCAIL